jgi:hypothetical protein
MGSALAVVAGAASADAFRDPLTNPANGLLTFSGFSDGSVGATVSGGITNNPSAGQFYGSFDTDGGSAELDDYLRFFCLDIYHWANTGPNAYTRDILGNTLPVTPTQLLLLTRLFDQYYPNKTDGTYYDGGQTGFGDFATATDSAAFQIAIWQIYFGTGSSSNAGVQNEVNTMLGFINSESGAAPPGWTFFSFTSQPDRYGNHYQNYLSVEWSEPSKETPEPGTLILLCSAVLVAYAAALRRRQTA